jgi:hypothetical protein
MDHPSFDSSVREEFVRPFYMNLPHGNFAHGNGAKANLIANWRTQPLPSPTTSSTDSPGMVFGVLAPPREVIQASHPF